MEKRHLRGGWMFIWMTDNETDADRRWRETIFRRAFTTLIHGRLRLLEQNVVILMGNDRAPQLRARNTCVLNDHTCLTSALKWEVYLNTECRLCIVKQGSMTWHLVYSKYITNAIQTHNESNTPRHVSYTSSQSCDATNTQKKKKKIS